jgi:zinc/manganese transport system permease protein
MSIIDIMAAPFAECMVLVAIHTYLGIHVLRRRVIFVDLALAQTAALGTTVGFLFGIMPDTAAALVFSMLFTFIGAAIFALTRIQGERVPQEAVIGLFYAIMAASAVLVVQKTHGAEHMDDILVGSILWVKWKDVLIAAVAYGVIGIVHYLFRRQFFLISASPDEAYRRGMNVKAWDFLFYLTFGFVISFSVRVAGVLLVFVFLVAPAIMAFIVTDRLKPQLIIGWSMGTVVTILGLFLSYTWDLPSGPAVVSFYGVVLIIGALGVYVVRAPRKAPAIKWIGVGGIVAAAAIVGVYGIGRSLSATDWATSEAHERVENDIVEAERRSEKIVSATLKSTADKVRSRLNGLTLTARVPEDSLEAYAACEDEAARLSLITATLETNRDCGLALLADFLTCEETPMFFRSEGAALLRQEIGDDVEYDPEKRPEENRVAILRLIDADKKR